MPSSKCSVQLPSDGLGQRAISGSLPCGGQRRPYGSRASLTRRPFPLLVSSYTGLPRTRRSPPVSGAASPPASPARPPCAGCWRPGACGRRRPACRRARWRRPHRLPPPGSPARPLGLVDLLRASARSPRWRSAPGGVDGPLAVEAERAGRVAAARRSPRDPGTPGTARRWRRPRGPGRGDHLHPGEVPEISGVVEDRVEVAVHAGAQATRSGHRPRGSPPRAGRLAGRSRPRSQPSASSMRTSRPMRRRRPSFASSWSSSTSNHHTSRPAAPWE